jgi:hypothetical protein
MNIRELLQEIYNILKNHSEAPRSLEEALQGDDDMMWEFLTSNQLWGGAGSVADQAILEFPEERSELELKLIDLGRMQLELQRPNLRTEMWVSAFEKQ